MNGEKQRIGINTTIILGIFAFCIDLLQILLDAVIIGVVVNRIIDVFVTFGFWLVFRMMGVNFTKTRAFVFFGLALLEMFPGLDAFPLWTLDVVAVCMMTMAEDKIGILKNLSGTFAKGGAGAAKASMTMAQQKALKRTASVIMNRAKQLNQNAPGSVSREDEIKRRQIANTPDQTRLLGGNREQKIAAQRQQKQNKENANTQS